MDNGEKKKKNIAKQFKKKTKELGSFAIWT